MLKTVVQLALAALVVNAAWRTGSAYLTFYRFKDAITETALYGAQKTTAQIEQRVVELASQYDIPLAQDGFSVRRDDRSHTYIDGSYTQPLELVPGYRYDWPFMFHVDQFTMGPVAAPAAVR